jgi:Icc-related predicted phosphoesterase
MRVTRERRSGNRWCVIKVAAAGDIHAGGPGDERLVGVFADAAREADLILLAGDLTRHGDPDETARLFEAVQGIEVPVFAVLGNHDWHGNRHDELTKVLSQAGIGMLDKESAVVDVGETSVGIAGVKGFVGGFPDASLPDFGEPSLRKVYAETTDEVEGLGRALEEISSCDVRIALLHYAPTSATLEGEPPGIWAFLGSDRLAGPIAQHRPDIVFHGHGHMGRFKGEIGDVPVYNVAQAVIGKDFEVFELG